jgi:peptidoglycan L-alanyl-D-glutamate endopeptidase CwlK
MTKYRLGAQSLARLKGVHPQLARVVQGAIEKTKQDFMVLEGVRSKETMWEYWGKGRTASQCRAAGVPEKYAKPGLAKVTWLNNPLGSNHRIMADGFGHAVDLCPFPVDWNDAAKFDAIADAMFAAAKELGVKIRWGADWDQDGNPRERGETDSPHFEVA